MPLVLRGSSVLLSGPTASGKTEAAVGPLYQRHVSFRRAGLSIVYVAPTKALVNDLYERLRSYFAASDPDVIQRYTGDHHGFRTAAGALLLVSTPEALDSLQLTRPNLLTGVRAVVIDEIHAVHGAPRGQQLRHLIGRLRVAAGAPGHARDEWQVVGMTATVQEARGVADKWMGEGAPVVAAGERRDIDLSIRRPLAAEDMGAAACAETIAEWLAEQGSRKLLVFANTRNHAHELAAALHTRLEAEGWPVHLHVGVLTRTMRERVEEDMRGGTRGICVATSTLELGIDIGDVDTVVLAAPPTSVASFVQRIGRGNRRSGTCQVLAVSASDDTDGLFRALLECARCGALEDVHEYDRPSVRFQQVLSIAWRATRLDQALTRQRLVELTGDPGHLDVVEDMLVTGCLRDVHGALVPSDELLDEGDRREIHSVIVGGGGVPIVDSQTGEVLATGGKQAMGGTVFLGRFAALDASRTEAMYVDRSAGRTGRHLARLQTGRSGDRGLSRPVMWAMAKAAGRDPRVWDVDGRRLQTWGGRRYNTLLAALVRSRDRSARVTVDDVGLLGLEDPDAWTPDLFERLAAELQAAASLPLEEARRFRDPSRYLSHLSRELQSEEARRAVPFGPVRTWLRGCSR